ncbi:MAG: glycogen/starch/alpha-glucan phosphorylase [Sulfolobales archaeon]
MIVSITPEIGIDEVPIYAGGLGILEGDKFLEASKLGLEYTVLTLFYRRGYVYYKPDPQKGYVQEERDFSYLLEKLKREDPLETFFSNIRIVATPYLFERNSAKIVYFYVEKPDEIARKVEKLYIEEDPGILELKYSLLAKLSLEYMDKRIGFEKIDVVDMQESLASLISIILPHWIRRRLVIHTPGPWGHPRFSHETLAREFGYIDGETILTKISASRSEKVFTVSEKHYRVTRATFPEFESKLDYVTNGVSLDRWMHPRIREFVSKGSLDKEDFWRIHIENKKDLLNLLRNYKGDIDSDISKPIIAWVRRLTRYKRPYFMIRLIEDTVSSDEVIFVLGGKAHPRDLEGFGYMKIFKELHEEYKNVVYLHDYDAEKAKIILSGSDLLLFTPFPGWEASGTSFMKAGVNGVPTLASRDGAALEIIRDGFNGWFFGSDIDYPIDLYSSSASEIDQRDYKDLYERYKEIVSLYYNNKDQYINIMINTLETFRREADINRVIREYYSEFIKKKRELTRN